MSGGLSSLEPRLLTSTSSTLIHVGHATLESRFEAMVILSASVERIGVSRMRDSFFFLFHNSKYKYKGPGRIVGYYVFLYFYSSIKFANITLNHGQGQGQI